MSYAPGGQPQWSPPPAPLWQPQSGPPAAHKWYVVYVVLMTLLYIGLAVVGAILLTADIGDTAAEPEEFRINGVVFLAMHVPLAVLFGIGAFLPKRSWGWIFGLVLIIIGLTSCITWPITIPVLIAWIKPEMKAYYGKD